MRGDWARGRPTGAVVSRESTGTTGRHFLVEIFLIWSWSGSMIRFPTGEYRGAAWVPTDHLSDLARLERAIETTGIELRQVDRPSREGLGGERRR